MNALRYALLVSDKAVRPAQGDLWTFWGFYPSKTALRLALREVPDQYRHCFVRTGDNPIRHFPEFDEALQWRHNP